MWGRPPLVTLRGASYEWYRHNFHARRCHPYHLRPRHQKSQLPLPEYKTSLYCLVETIQIRTRAEPDGTANTFRDDNRLSQRSTAPIPRIVYYYIFNAHNSPLIKNDTIKVYSIYVLSTIVCIFYFIFFTLILYYLNPYTTIT